MEHSRSVQDEFGTAKVADPRYCHRFQGGRSWTQLAENWITSEVKSMYQPIHVISSSLSIYLLSNPRRPNQKSQEVSVVESMLKNLLSMF